MEVLPGLWGAGTRGTNPGWLAFSFFLFDQLEFVLVSVKLLAPVLTLSFASLVEPDAVPLLVLLVLLIILFHSCV